ncbi:MAG: dihydrolipoyllysine-residue acetyltransferase [Gammaproteobacteria bacterium]|nr:dihydrolipoyllysine-residue acetyltransferase [Gammaproteobacteria bacterium]
MNAENILVPDIGGATEVDVIEVLVKPGDQVNVDTPLITLESDKATMEVPSPSAGIVRELKVHVGDKLSQGSVILTLEKKNGLVSTEKKSTVSSTPVPTPTKQPTAPVAKPAAPVEEPAVIASSKGEDHAGPAVRKLARELGVDLSQVPPTGPKQRILKEDIEAYVKSRLQQGGGGAAFPAAPTVDFAKFGPVHVQPLSRIKKISGKNLHRNWVLVPHVTQFGEADVTELEAFRQQQKQALEKQNIRLTMLVFVMKALVSGLKKFPQFNASLDPSGENLIYKDYFHVGVAVDTPDGLVVPVVRDVDQKSLSQLAKELAELSEKARKKQLTPNEMQGGCFSISSLGGIGGTAFTPIVNLPEVAILGVSKSFYKPVYRDGTFVPRLMLPLSLSFDHRVIDGADGARFIEHLANMLSDIRNLLI